ncbi:MAG TPA: radical SAM protein [Myxococcota bacterium]|nr:radical SAM protein [Myxococcota bacterium]
MKGHVAFVFPRTRYRSGDPPLGVALLAAIVRRDRPAVSVSVIDGTFLGGRDRLLDRVRSCGADLVAVYADSLMLPDALAVGRVARASGAFALAGGPLATVAPDLLLPGFDAVFRGEGDGAIAAIVDRVLAGDPLADVPGCLLPGPDGAPFDAGPVAHPEDLDGLPFPAWDLLDMPRYIRLWPYLDGLGMATPGTNVVASRGCPWHCAYCQPTLSAIFGRRVRRYSPGRVAEEVAALQAQYGIAGVFFHDDTMTASPRWLDALFAALARLPRPPLWGCNARVDTLDVDRVDRMHAAGMRAVHLGIEAGSARVRADVLRKPIDIAHLETLTAHLRRRGVHALGFFMLGSPTETVGEMLQTLRLARRLPLTEATFSITSVLPGSALADIVASDARFELPAGREADYYRRRNFVDREHPLGDLSLRAIQYAGLVGFYLHPLRAGYLARHLGSVQGLRKLAMKAGRFLQPIG